MNKKQMVWHAYHTETLCQFVNLKTRRALIDAIKPDHELPTRLRLMKPVVGELPIEFVAACKKESAAQRRSARRSWKVRKAAWKARGKSYTKHKAEIERLHAIECPGCPWDGQTIFPEV